MAGLLSRASVIGAFAAALSLGACASQESVEKAQATADEALSTAQSAQSAAARAQSTADQAGAAAAAVNNKVDTFIREECNESAKEARTHSACPPGSGGVRG
jgi:hypothetical protein